MGKTFLLAIDAHSKWGEVQEMSSTTAVKTVEVLRRMFAAYGLPLQIVTNNGPQFVSQEFADFMKSNGVRHTQCTPYHPASNGEAERFVRTFKESMKAGKYDGLSLSLRLQNFLASYRTTPHSTTGIAPCELFLGRKLRTRLDLIKPDVCEQVITKQCQQKDKHDLHARFRELHIGQKVMVRNMRPGPVWIPGEVIQKLGPLTYLIDVYGDKPWKCHLDQLKERGDTSTGTAGPYQLVEEEPQTAGIDSAPSLEREALEEIVSEPTETETVTPQVQIDASGETQLPGGNSSGTGPPVLPAGTSQSTTTIPHKYPLRDRSRHRRT